MRGHLGQYVIVIPEDDMIIVRLGHKKITSAPGTVHTEDFDTYTEEAYKMLKGNSN